MTAPHLAAAATMVVVLLLETAAAAVSETTYLQDAPRRRCLARRSHACRPCGSRGMDCYDLRLELSRVALRRRR